MRIWVAFALGTVLFYSLPLFSPRASIHWDLADVAYPAQKYFEESIRDGKLPQWTPYLDSGIPFLSDPRAGAWYPPHWPFYAIGITPRAMVWELALHAFLALSGAFLLARRLFGDSGPAALGAVLYAFGGFFASRSSNLGLFEVAALLPWLLWATLSALENGKLGWMALAGMAGGFIVLADAQAAIACLGAFLGFTVAAKGPWKRTVAVISITVIGAVLVGSIQLLPALELSKVATHQEMGGAPLRTQTLATLVTADYFGMISGLYSGPDDIRQHYLYSGLLLVPLALAGFIRRKKLWPLLALVIPAAVYGFVGTRKPMDVWFVAALGLAMAAASGMMWAAQRAGRPRLWAALLILSATDLWFWNMYKNPLVFARTSFTDLYSTDKPVVAGPLDRIWAPFIPISRGPADGPLLSHTEVTYGLGFAQPDRYADYLRAADGNPKLLNGLGVTQVIEAHNQLKENPRTLGRVSAPSRIQFVTNRAAAQAALATLDPAQAAVVEAAPRTLSPDVSDIAILNYQRDFYRIRYLASGTALLRIALPYFPGWSASIDGQSVDLVPVDEALTGVFVPAGEHQISLQFRPKWFKLGAVLSLAGLAALLLLLALSH
jgi:hypothetical protein